MARLKNHSSAYWLNDAAAAAFNRMEDEQGFIDLNSAGRTLEEQQEAINRWYRGGPANRPPNLYRPAEPASSSRHVINGGIAFDTSEYNRVRQFCERYGFRWWGSSDPVHFEYVGGGTAGSGSNFSQDVKNQQAWLISRGYDLGPSGADGDYGPSTMNAFKKYQEFLRAYGYTGPIDGEWGNGTQVAHQKYYDEVQRGGKPVNEAVKQQQAWLISRGYDLGSSGADGDYGPKTKEAFQKYQEFLRGYGYTGPIDGEWGQGTQDAHAKYYNEVVNGAPAQPTSPSGEVLLEVDGEMGEKTWRRVQERLGNVKVDGEPGPETYKSLQTALGQTADGDFGKISTKALQTLIGADPIDGEWGNGTTRKLQEFLNNGGKFTKVILPPDPVVSNPIPNPNTPLPSGIYPYSSWSKNTIRGDENGPIVYIAKDKRENVCVHWDGGATPKTEDEALQLLRNYEQYHITSANAGALRYNFAISPVTGNIYEGRGFDQRAMAVGSGNTPNISVIVIGGPGNLTENAKNGLRKFYKLTNEYLGRKAGQKVHSDFNSTTCPGPEITPWVKSGGLESTVTGNEPETPTQPSDSVNVKKTELRAIRDIIEEEIAKMTAIKDKLSKYIGE